MRKIIAVVMLMVVMATAVVPSVRANSFNDLMNMNILWRAKWGTMDYLTTISSADERNPSYSQQNQIFYIANSGNTPNTRPIYSLWNYTGDHMDDQSASVPPYTSPVNLGNMWTGQPLFPGLLGIDRIRNPQNGDHATIRDDEAIFPGYNPPHYDWQYMGYGLPRYNNTTTDLLPLTSSTSDGQTVVSNKAVGGAIWSWQWGGTEFINTFDYGREMQSALFYTNADNNSYNPTEAGDCHSGPGVPTEQRHGSPLVSGSASATTQSTRSIPLEYTSLVLGDTLCQQNLDHPSLHQNVQLGKDVTFKWLGMSGITKYHASIDLVGGSLDAALWSIPAVFLRGDFHQYYTYKAPNNARTDVTHCVDGTQPTGWELTNCAMDQDAEWPAPSYGGVIISDASQTHAMGVFGVGRSVSGSVTEYNLQDFGATTYCVTTSCGAGSPYVSGMSANWGTFPNPGGRLPLPTGWSARTTWIVTGSLSDVQTRMYNLYQHCLTYPMCESE